MCFELKFLPFHHLRFCQSLIPLILYVKKDIFHYFSHYWTLKWQLFTPIKSLNSYNAIFALNECIQKKVTYVTVIKGT